MGTSEVFAIRKWSLTMCTLIVATLEHLQYKNYNFLLHFTLFPFQNGVATRMYLVFKFLDISFES